MKAMAIKEFGGADALRLSDLPDPLVGPDIVLVRTRAAGVNPVDYKMCKGSLANRYPCHFPLVPGWDVAGVVEAVGPAVPEFTVGDEVLGYVRRDEVQWGTFAELVPAPVRTLTRKPTGMSWVEAAALPLAGLTAWQAMTRVLRVGPGDTVLVHAAAGGVGTFAVQMARRLGAERVIGTASEANHAHLRSLGVEPVVYGDGLVDRVRALAPQGVRAVLDLAGGNALEASAAVLGDGGRLASVVDPVRVKALGGGYWFVRPDAADLAQLCGLVEAGQLSVHVERSYRLEEAPDALRQVETGHGRGKVVLEVSVPS